MADRVAADNPSVETVRATLARAGGTDRPTVEFPPALDRPEEVVRLSFDGRTHHALVERAVDDTLEIRGAYDTPGMAREASQPDGGRVGPNRLVEWVERSDLSVGRSVLLDVVDPGAFYGLREPGESAVYEVPGTPDESLSNIAAEIERREEGR